MNGTLDLARSPENTFNKPKLDIFFASGLKRLSVLSVLPFSIFLYLDLNASAAAHFMFLTCAAPRLLLAEADTANSQSGNERYCLNVVDIFQPK